jgi:hypothetical protein
LCEKSLAVGREALVVVARKRVSDFQRRNALVSDSTFTWNGGTGSASDETNWTVTGPSNTPNIPQSDDSIVISSGDAQFTDMPLPGQDNGIQGGTVFFQGGTIDMINGGATAGVLANTLVQVTNTVAADGTLTASGDSTNDGTIDVDTNGTLTFSLLSGTATNNGLIEALNGGILSITGAGTFVNAGTVIADSGGSVIVSAPLTGTTSSWLIGPTSSGTIEINTPVASSQSNVFDFQGLGLLKLDQLATFQGEVFEPGGGDVIDIGTANVGTLIVTGTGNPGDTASLLLEDAGGGSLGTFFLKPFGTDIVQTGTFTYGAGGSNNDAQIAFGTGGSDTLMTVDTSIVACFMAGTRIATDQGEVAVEDLAVGDCLPTVVSEKLSPIVWIGHRTIDCSRHPKPQQVWPVRIAAGAFGRAKPSRELWLSPDHAVYVEGALIPVKYLINGSSIAQVPQVSVTYYHVELSQHDVVLANGLEAESFLAGSTDSTIFANTPGPIALHPDLSSRLWEAEGCAPLVVTGPVLEAAKRRVRVPRSNSAPRRRAKAA